jgi:hypothetical protein
VEREGSLRRGEERAAVAIEGWRRRRGLDEPAIRLEDAEVALGGALDAKAALVNGEMMSMTLCRVRDYAA